MVCCISLKKIAMIVLTSICNGEFVCFVIVLTKDIVSEDADISSLIIHSMLSEYELLNIVSKYRYTRESTEKSKTCQFSVNTLTNFNIGSYSFCG